MYFYNSETILTTEEMNTEEHILTVPLCFSVTYEEAKYSGILGRYKDLYGEKLEQAGIVQDINSYSEEDDDPCDVPAVYIPVQSDAKAELDIVYAAAIEELEDKMRKAAKALGADAVTNLHYSVLADPNAFEKTRIVMYGKAIKRKYPNGSMPL